MTNAPTTARDDDDPGVTVYVSIGGPDDTLTQTRWAQYIAVVDTYVRTAAAGRVDGQSFSAPTSPTRCACWRAQVSPARLQGLQTALSRTAADFDQDSIVWAQVPQIQHLPAVSRFATGEPR